MRRIGTLFAGGLTAGLIIAAAVVNAAPSDVRTGPDLLAYCPALEEGSGCPEAAASFLQSASPSDVEIVQLVITIAEEADLPTVPKTICLDAAAGLRVLAEGTSSADHRQEILNIADALCKNSATGATGDDDVDNNGINGGGNGNAGAGGGSNGTGDGSSSQVSLPSGASSQPSSQSSSQSSDPSSMSSSQPAVDNCAGNSDPGNGNNCDNPNNSDHSSQSSASEQPPAGGDCAGNSTPKNGKNCDNPNNS